MTDRAELAKELIAFANKIGNRLGPVTGDVMDDAANKLRQAAAALSAGEGGAIPKFPTDEMICAGDEAIVRDLNRLESERRETDPTPAELCWAAMVTERPKEISLSSAPVPAGASEEGLRVLLTEEWNARIGPHLEGNHDAEIRAAFEAGIAALRRLSPSADLRYLTIEECRAFGAPGSQNEVTPIVEDGKVVAVFVYTQHASGTREARRRNFDHPTYKKLVATARARSKNNDSSSCTPDLLKAAKAEQREADAQIARDCRENDRDEFNEGCMAADAAIRNAEGDVG